MSGDVTALLQNYAAAKRRFSVELNLLEDMRALAKQAADVLPDVRAVLEEKAKPLETRLSDAVMDLYAQIERAEDIIGHVEEPLYKEVLERRYMQQAEFKEIAQAMHYSERHVRRMHRAAIERAAQSENQK